MPGHVEALDLDDTYGFTHPLNRERELSRQQVCASESPPNFLWWIEFYENTRESVLEYPLCYEARLLMEYAAG